MPNALSQLPQGLIPIAIGECAQPLSAAVVVDAQARQPVVLRELIDGRVLLGCVIDGAKRLHRYLEIWVQHPSSLRLANHLAADTLDNARLDRKWTALARAWAALGSEDVIDSEWASNTDRIIQIDLAAGRTRDFINEQGTPLRLCRDEEKLAAAGLASYRASLERYLTDGMNFIPADADAAPKSMPLLNPEGGPILIRALHPLELAAYSDWLGGASRELSIGGARPETPWNDSGSCADAAETSWLLNSFGRSGRLTEVFYLKLALLRDAIAGVRDLVEHTALPLLNLSADSFRVSGSRAGCALPDRWAAKTVLSTISQATPLSIPGLEKGCFVSGVFRGEAAYRPAAAKPSVSGIALLRLRRVSPGSDGRVTVEATLVAPSLAPPAKTDLIWLRASVDGVRSDWWGRIESGETSGPSEFRFKSFEISLPPERVNALRAAEGSSIAETAYSITPALSSPCDLHALGVLAIRLLLVNSQHSLAVALDELMSLSRRAKSIGGDLAIAIASLRSKDSELAASTGPQQMMFEPAPFNEAAFAIPQKLWARVLAFIIRCLPGETASSFAADCGDAPPSAIHRVFDPAMEEVALLSERARGLIFIDGFSLREIASVIRERGQQSEQLLKPSEPKPEEPRFAQAPQGETDDDPLQIHRNPAVF